MTDRELLESAAKAVGLVLSHGPVGTLAKKKGERYYTEHWNPLEDDGDALRLAVKLGIEIIYLDGVVEARWRVADRFGGNVMEEVGSLRNGPESYAAVCRAIVRAAAALSANRSQE